MTTIELYVVTKENQVIRWVDAPCDSNEAFRGTKEECERFALNVRAERFQDSYEAHIADMEPGGW